MAWQIIFDEDFADWLDVESDALLDAIEAVIVPLAEAGPQLGRPMVDTIKGSKLANLKEPRFRVGRDPYRIQFAFDPIRRAILLVGGSKRGDKRWYEVNIPIAEARFARHLARVDRDRKS